jgi:hypothetical protein
MPNGSGEFRVLSWRLNPDYSIDIQGRTTTDSMYDLVAGPKPADVVPDQVTEEILIDTGVPGVVLGTPKLADYGTFAVVNIEVQPDASGNMNIAGAYEIAMGLYYVDELATDLWGSLDADLDDTTDPATVACTVNPDTSRVFRVGDFIVFNDEAADANHAGKRSYECAQVTGPGSEGDVVPTGNFVLTRAYPGVLAGQATFLTWRCAHKAGIRFYKLDMLQAARQNGRAPYRPRKHPGMNRYGGNPGDGNSLRNPRRNSDGDKPTCCRNNVLRLPRLE